MRNATPYALLTVLLLAVLPSLASGQSNRIEDGRWLPWIGCWEGGAAAGDAEGSYLVCFRPLADGTGVEIESHATGSPATREAMRADGIGTAVDEGGCAGERLAGWSTDGRRLYLSSQMACGAGVTRSTRGLLAVLPSGQGWIEIQEVQAGSDAPLIGIRSFVPASAATLVERGISDPGAALQLATTTARAQASVPLSPDALVELVERAGPAVGGALIVERGEPFDLDARTLRELADRGIPGEVLDVMVALSYPDRFALTGGGSSPEAELRTESGRARTSERDTAPWPARGYRGYSPWGFGGYDPFFYDPFYYRGGRYGYGGDPFGYPYYGGPRVIIVEPPQVEERSSILSRERGVQPTGTPANGGSAPNAPAPRRGNAEAAPAPDRSNSPPATGGRSGSGGADTGGEVRRAVPRSGG